MNTELLSKEQLDRFQELCRNSYEETSVILSRMVEEGVISLELAEQVYGDDTEEEKDMLVKQLIDEYTYPELCQALDYKDDIHIEIRANVKIEYKPGLTIDGVLDEIRKFGTEYNIDIVEWQSCGMIRHVL